MKFIIITIILIAITAFTFTTKPTFDEIEGKSYHPIVIGQKFIYKTDHSTYSKTFDNATVVINEKSYIKCITNFGYSQSISFYREEGDRVLYIKPNQTLETVQIPENISVGLVWYESDSTWKYTVKSLKETLETPEANYLNCLVIQSENVNYKSNSEYFKQYFQYYQKGRGYIGTKLEGRLYSYVTLNE